MASAREGARACPGSRVCACVGAPGRARAQGCARRIAQARMGAGAHACGCTRAGWRADTPARAPAVKSQHPAAASTRATAGSVNELAFLVGALGLAHIRPTRPVSARRTRSARVARWAVASTHRSSGRSPVCFEILASIRGPISSSSWNANTKSAPPARAHAALNEMLSRSDPASPCSSCSAMIRSASA